MRRGAGGTPGGLIEFLLGAGMVMVGCWLFLQKLTVSSSFRVLWGTGGSGLALLILLVGIGVVFFSGRSLVGWILIAVGVVMIIISVISNLVIYFEPTSLFNTVVMLGLIFGGIGLVLRALRPHSE